jgi:hypothetical protein
MAKESGNPIRNSTRVGLKYKARAEALAYSSPILIITVISLIVQTPCTLIIFPIGSGKLRLPLVYGENEVFFQLSVVKLKINHKN